MERGWRVCDTTLDRHPSEQRCLLWVGPRTNAVLAVVETATGQSAKITKLVKHDLLALYACRIECGSGHSADGALILSSGAVLQMRPAAKEDTGPGEPYQGKIAFTSECALCSGLT